MQQVPATEDTRKLRGRIVYGQSLAAKAEATADELAAARLCLESVTDYGETMGEHYYGTERAKSEGRRADDAAGVLQLRIDALVAAIVPPPPPPSLSPPEQWAKKNRRLVGLTTAAGVSVAAGLLMAIVPWVGSCNDPYHGCIYTKLTLTTIGAPVAFSASIGLVAWSIRLVNHRANRPPGLVLGRRFRMELALGGVKLGR